MRPHPQSVVRSDRLSTGRRRGFLALLLAAVLSLSIFSGAVGGVPRSFAVAAVGLFSRQAVPEIPYLNNANSMEVGLRFSSDRDGRVVALQFYRSEKQDGSYIGTLWSADGDVLGHAVFAKSDQVGWQTANLDEPVRIEANESYTASYFAKDGYPAATRDFFTEVYSRYGLTVPVNGGVSKISAKSMMPTGYLRGTNYMVDVVFVTSLDREPQPVPTPSPTTVSPTPTTSPTTTTPRPSPTTPSTTPPHHDDAFRDADHDDAFRDANANQCVAVRPTNDGLWSPQPAARALVGRAVVLLEVPEGLRPRAGPTRRSSRSPSSSASPRRRLAVGRSASTPTWVPSTTVRA